MFQRKYADKSFPILLQEPGRAPAISTPASSSFLARPAISLLANSPPLSTISEEKDSLPPNFACVGFARSEKTHEQFRDELKQDIIIFSRVKPIDEALWKNFQEQIFYHRSEFDDDARLSNRCPLS